MAWGFEALFLAHPKALTPQPEKPKPSRTRGDPRGPGEGALTRALCGHAGRRRIEARRPGSWEAWGDLRAERFGLRILPGDVRTEPLLAHEFGVFFFPTFRPLKVIRS